ncbi:MAG TPA: enoyl-CoA hydratase-related protein [Thermoanaerobaculia bacterium]|nr:enoyl-CoA hydratase-related protein [Thermoanaerobaculia bacterium]
MTDTASATTYHDVRYRVDDPVATVTLSRPERLNAFTGRMLLEMAHAVAQAERDERVVGIVLTGEGRGFCAGADMEMLRSVSAGEGRAGEAFAGDLPSPGAEEMGDEFKVGYAYLMAVRKPILAAINGPCAGLGFAIALLCDLRFASDHAVFTSAFANRGLIAEHGTSWILPRLVGPANALDILWSGRKFDAEEALRLGAVNRVVPHDELMAQATGYLRGLAQTSAPRSLMIMKQQVYRHLNATLGPALRESIELMNESLTREEFREGVASFLEKRPPAFPRIGSAG